MMFVWSIKYVGVVGLKYKKFLILVFSVWGDYKLGLYK